VDFDSASVIRRRNDQWFAAAGIARRVAFSVNDVDTLLELVASGLGIAIVPDGVARRSATVRCLALPDAVATFETGAVVPANRPVSVTAQRLLDMIVAAAAGTSPDELGPLP
jgi:DNA-binding transcriptional LysR family regulator